MQDVYTSKVTIVGGGIVGICCALSLQERGINVRVIERGEPGQETSYGNAGIISPWSIIPQAMPGLWRTIPGLLLRSNGPVKVLPSFWPRMIPWAVRFLNYGNESAVRVTSDAMEILCGPTIDLFRRHLAGTGHESLIFDSYYVHAYRGDVRPSLDRLDYRIRCERGGQLEIIGQSDLRALEPALSSDFTSAVLIKGQARARSPGRIAQILAEKAKQQGAEFLKAELHSIVREHEKDCWSLHTSAGTLLTEKLIMAAGVWSADLLKPLGLKLPLIAERGYHVEFPKPGVELTHSVMDVEAKLVASSMEDGLRLAGLAEFGAIDAPADPRKENQLIDSARTILPDLCVEESRFWMGRRPSFPDSLPALGPVQGNPGLFAAFGHSHYGLMMAPKTGEIIANMIAGTSENANLSHFDPVRF